MLTTADRYFAGISAFVEASRDEVPCVVAAITDKVTLRDPRVEIVMRPRWNLWQPEEEFCSESLSGWRKSHILRAGLLSVILNSGHDCLMADSDWQPTGAIAPVLIRLNQLSWDVSAIPDDWTNGCYRLMNIGLMWVRSTSATRGIAWRYANRTFVAWDQMILNQELEVASSVRCCASHHILQGKFAKGLLQSNNDAAKKAKNVQEPCRESRPRLNVLGPPAGCGGQCAHVYPDWNYIRFNEMSEGMTSRCVANPCDGIPEIFPSCGGGDDDDDD
eukprot:7265576-Prymnesium_polylepis.1